MIKPHEVPNGFRCWTDEYVNPNRINEAGWVAINSVNSTDCMPKFQLAGGGVSQDNLTDLPVAIEKSISNLNNRIHTATAAIRQLEILRSVL